jgi:hypothetical protein
MVVRGDGIELFFTEQVVIQQCVREIWVWAASG